MVEVALSVKEFAVLPLAVLSPPSLRTNGITKHYLYTRPHAPKVPGPDTPRSLFATNVPIDATLTHFRFLFSNLLDAGRVERVDFDSRGSCDADNLPRNDQVDDIFGKAPRGKKRKIGANGHAKEALPNLPNTWDRLLHKSGSTAVIVFVDRASMERAVKRIKKAGRATEPLAWADAAISETVAPLGSSRYRAHHSLQYPPASELQSVVNNFMSNLSAREAALSAERTRQRTEPDADGFITVTRGGRVGPGRSDEAQEKFEKLREKEEKKRKDMEASGFYRFQARESKKKEAKDLMDRFHNDQRRMEEMSRHRKRQKPD